MGIGYVGGHCTKLSSCECVWNFPYKRNFKFMELEACMLVCVYIYTDILLNDKQRVWQGFYSTGYLLCKKGNSTWSIFIGGQFCYFLNLVISSPGSSLHQSSISHCHTFITILSFRVYNPYMVPESNPRFCQIPNMIQSESD